MRILALLGVLCLCVMQGGCQSIDSVPSVYSNYPSAGHQSIDEIPMAKPVAEWETHKSLPSNFPNQALQAPSQPAPQPRSAAVCVMDAYTGRVLFEHNGRSPRQVASTQKLMTALTVLDAGSLNKTVVIQDSDTKAEPTKLGLRVGQQYKRGDLLCALMIKSYNDVALALARDAAGSLSNFMRQMNAKARAIGMRSSYFANPNGLPAAQYSTAVDMARCAYFCYRDPDLRKMVQMQQMRFPLSSGKVITIENTNKLLKQYPWVTGMKTGYTNLAKRCLVSAGGINGRHVIVVVLGCKPSAIWDESSQYLRWALGV